jgi:hypothetical protein
MAELQLPTKDEQKKYLEAQRDAIVSANFRSLVARELNKVRLETVTDKEEVRAIEDELEQFTKTEEGNNQYLEVIEKFLKEL